MIITIFLYHDRPLSAIVFRFTVRLAHSLQDGDDRLMRHDRLLSAIVSLSRSDRPIPSRMATNVLCGTIGPSAPSYPAHVQLVHPLQGGDERLMHHDRLLSAIVSLSRSDRPIPSRMATNVLCSAIGPSAPSYPAHVQLVHPLQGGDERLMHHDRLLSAIVSLSHSARPFPSTMATNVLCSAIGPSAPSYPAHVQLVHPLQGGDERLMHHDRLLSAIVSLSHSARPFPSTMATNVLCSAIGPSAPSYPAHVQLVHPLQGGDERLMHHDRLLSAIVSLSRSDRPIPSRMATNVLCSAIGPSAPSYPAHVQLVHPLQGGDERLMHHDRLLSAIVSLSHSARPFPSTMATNVLCSAIGPSAPSYPAHVQLVHPLQGGDERLMHHDRLLSAIVSLSHSARPFPSTMATNVLCSAIGPSAPSYLASRFGSPIPSRMATTVLCSTIGFSAPSCLHSRSARPFPSRMATNVLCSAIGPSAPSYLASRFGSPIPSRMATTVLCGTIGFSAPSCLFHVRSPIPSRMATNVLCSAIGPSTPSYLASRFGSPIPSRMATTVLCSTIGFSAPSCLHSRSARPFPSRMATNVLCSAIGPSAPSYLASRFGSPIPSRMATTVLCITIGPSAPSCLLHVRIAHSLQDGDERPM
ncbi:unnamed protein product [Cuscuta epithymum]|uniref:Uncharacterized protein n=1 Tax=Cuscuta epithymum TaxID=186058 RepID=A0AAV0C4V7_9ASTE|nr:unnamed protein product [Cuscuta epithymum]